MTTSCRVVSYNSPDPLSFWLSVAFVEQTDYRPLESSLFLSLFI